MTKLECIYNRTIFSNESNSFRIVSYCTDNDNLPSELKGSTPETKFTAVGYGLPITEGVNITLSGSWSKKESYGYQFDVETFKEELPQTNEGIYNYLKSGHVKGIGKKTAELIVNEFGENTFNVIENEPEKLLTIPRISKTKLSLIKKSYQENIALKEIITYLTPYQVTAKQAVKIYAKYGSQSMDIVLHDTYSLCDIKGFAFKTVDKIALNLKIDPDSIKRIKGAILFSLNQCAVSGHLFLNKNELISETLALLNAGFNKEVVASEDISYVIHSSSLKNEIVVENEAIYRKTVHNHEKYSAAMISELIGSSSVKMNIDADIAEAERKLKMILSDKQKVAIKSFFDNQLSIVTGGPGTGKTTILKFIIYIIKNRLKSDNILLAAPTGRASRRMSESTGFHNAMTIHKALSLNTEEDTEDFSYLTEEYIILDESSMIDMRLLYEFLRRIVSGTKILFVGDYNQLPSVGAGNVFRELINSGQIPVTVLDLVYRQSETSRIAINADKIVNNQYDLNLGDDFQVIPSDNDADVASIVKNLYLNELKNGANTDQVLILSPFRKNAHSAVGALNIEIQNEVNPFSKRKPEIKYGDKVFRLGDKVMQLKNSEFISNGDIGFITRIGLNEQKEKCITIKFSDNRICEYSTDDLSMIEHAYAMTIHKSQGSECDTVIIPIIRNFYPLLKRNLIYTGITRAKKKVILVGEKRFMLFAMKRNDIDKRNTMLGKRIHDIQQCRKKVV